MRAGAVSPAGLTTGHVRPLTKRRASAPLGCHPSGDAPISLPPQMSQPKEKQFILESLVSRLPLETRFF